MTKNLIPRLKTLCQQTGGVSQVFLANFALQLEFALQFFERVYCVKIYQCIMSLPKAGRNTQSHSTPRAGQNIQPTNKSEKLIT